MPTCIGQPQAVTSKRTPGLQVQEAVMGKVEGLIYVTIRAVFTGWPCRNRADVVVQEIQGQGIRICVSIAVRSGSQSSLSSLAKVQYAMKTAVLLEVRIKTGTPGKVEC